MRLKFIVAAFVVAVLPLGAHAQKAPKPTKAAAQHVVDLISGDKAKVKLYCDMAKLDEQISQADQKKDTKKGDELSDRMDKMAQQLGPEYIALMTGLQDMNQDAKET